MTNVVKEQVKRRLACAENDQDVKDIIHNLKGILKHKVVDAGKVKLIAVPFGKSEENKVEMDLILIPKGREAAITIGFIQLMSIILDLNDGGNKVSLVPVDPKVAYAGVR